MNEQEIKNAITTINQKVNSTDEDKLNAAFTVGVQNHNKLRQLRNNTILRNILITGAVFGIVGTVYGLYMNSNVLNSAAAVGALSISGLVIRKLCMKIANYWESSKMKCNTKFGTLSTTLRKGVAHGKLYTINERKSNNNF
jgi:hypothetical protein